ncbi:MAG TPA: hypothetical protein VN851_15965 [Thermoanaerobaculia bacterium]|nr:hypothetical protein [Thermoanaerobaculia bacterium]
MGRAAGEAGRADPWDVRDGVGGRSAGGPGGETIEPSAGGFKWPDESDPVF